MKANEWHVSSAAVDVGAISRPPEDCTVPVHDGVSAWYDLMEIVYNLSNKVESIEMAATKMQTELRTADQDIRTLQVAYDDLDEKTANHLFTIWLEKRDP